MTAKGGLADADHRRVIRSGAGFGGLSARGVPGAKRGVLPDSFPAAPT